MDNLSIDFKSMLPFVIDAFTKVYGEEYYDIISERVNDTEIIQYYDIEGLEQYIDSIKLLKRREYAIKFLDKIGVNVKKYIKDNYRQPLDDEIKEVLSYYIYSSYLGFSEFTDEYVPLQSFKINNDTDPRVLLKNKIKIINYLLSDNYKQITEENFDSFVGTEEYNKILKKINELNLIYEQLLLEYRNWEEQLRPYEELTKSEEQRKLEILEKKRRELFMDIYSRLPITVINAISNKTLEEKINIVLGPNDIGSTSNIEMFGFKNREKLKSKKIGFDEKLLIIYKQFYYLIRMGIEFPNKEQLLCNLKEDVYDSLNQEIVKKYLPSDNLVNYITSLRQDKYEEAIKEYYTTKDDFLTASVILSKTDSLYEVMKNKRTCTGRTRHETRYIPQIFYRISDVCGSLLYSFVHECGHAIDKVVLGFEEIIDFLEDTERNPYDDAFRKYEKFNETLNDIFTMEVVDLLHNQGIYIEPLEFTLLDVSNLNTSLIVKDLLKPLLSKFRKQVIAAKVNSDRDELIRYVGKDNFEELVDVVNKVDYLARNGVARKINESPDDEMVKEYFKQVERAKEIYINIDNYYNTDSYDKPKKNK